MGWNGTSIGNSNHLVSHTGHDLSRATSFRYALDVTPAQHQQLVMYAGARRATWNQHVARIKRNLWLRDEERAAGVPEEHLTPPEVWSPVVFINYINQFKKGLHSDCRPHEDGTLGWSSWHAEVSADVFETASVDAARAFQAFANSKKGERPGPRVGFPTLQKKDKTTPTFRLRSKSKPGGTAPVRLESNRLLRVPRLGVVKIRGRGSGCGGWSTPAGSTPTRSRSRIGTAGGGHPSRASPPRSTINNDHQPPDPRPRSASTWVSKPWP